MGEEKSETVLLGYVSTTNLTHLQLTDTPFFSHSKIFFLFLKLFSINGTWITRNPSQSLSYDELAATMAFDPEITETSRRRADS